MKRLHSSPLLLTWLLLAACGSGDLQSDEPLPDSRDPSYAQSFDGHVDPRVSSSAGEEGGVVVLWPRVVTSAGASAVFEASEVQAALRSIAERVFEGAPIDVRPDPQRTCPQSGCAGVAIGAVVLKSSSACAVVATVSRPGPTDAHLVAWVAEVELQNHHVPFREPPESHIRVVDFLPCAELATSLAANEPAVEELLRQTAP
ncbi:MAG: hypothetical protein JRH11_04730 [Deltaproteobacteria bacterium]|nr:hypothetical protein [Deltaproteobacteria bacterium]